MQCLLRMCENAMDYPCNLPQSPLCYHVTSLLNLLNEKEGQLFSTANEACVNFLELDVGGKGEAAYSGRTPADRWM